MDIKKFCEQFNSILDAAVEAVTLELMKEQLSERAYERCRHNWGWEFSHFDYENGVVLKQEYNDACGCHPEYEWAYIRIPWNLIEEKN